MVEEASAAAGSLEEQSKQLASAVSAFQLNVEHAAAKPVQAKKPVEVKHVELHKPVPAKKSAEAKKPVEAGKPKLHALPKKGNGHLEEGWQEF
jgi:methyl-accepting chemotaxis protein